MYPTIRLRRNRKHSWIRDLISESTLLPSHLILPLFVIEGQNLREKIETMPGVERLSIDQIIIQAQKAADLGIKAIALFPVIDTKLKSENAHEAYNSENLICRTIRAIKAKNLNIGIICDVALDPYTNHGHDGIVINEDVHNDATIKALCKQALTLARAGADIVAPSDMMDGRIGAIREHLDSEGFEEVSILAYAAKYASSFYGPFRDAVGSSGALGKNSKQTYQMDPRNISEAIREVELDIEEGADIIMIKPGMPYLDVIHAVSQNFSIPTFAYQVSGEYSMIKIGAENGIFEYEKTMLESLIAFRRAGARAIITYAAIEIASIL